MNYLKLFETFTTTYLAYHGSNNRFETFKTELTHTVDAKRLGAYFTASKNFALTYGNILYSVELTITNPFNVVGMSNTDLIAALPIQSGKAELMSAFARADKQHYGLLESAIRFGLRNELEQLSYDGIIYEEGYADAYIVFQSDQIKILD